MNSPLYDALIIGGGPAGATAGLLLARAGWNIAIMEQSAFPRRKVCGEFISAPTLALLETLGIADEFHAQAGPEVKRIGLFVGDAMLAAPMPRSSRSIPYGRALGRDRLDTLLLEQARRMGAHVLQPWKALRLNRNGEGFICTARHPSTGTTDFRTRLVIAAHGSWEYGGLPTQTPHRPVKGSDLLGFKAHFRAAKLPADLMPLLVFPGGYGGMVTADNGRVSLSCCIRRDRLEAVRQHGIPAGESVLRHIRRSCRGVDLALEGAVMEDDWLAAGPIRPGTRRPPMPGVFLVGNAAGEAHPIIADGISIAMQSAWLLCRSLSENKDRLDDQSLQEVALAYASAWHRQFALRIAASSVFAQLAIRPMIASLLLPAFKCMPPLLEAGARLAGKTMKIA